MGAVLKFCDLRREGTASGCVFFRNLLHDKKNNRIRPIALKRFGQLIESKHITTSNIGGDIVANCLADATNFSQLALQGYTLPKHKGRLAKVVNGQDLLNYNMRKKDGTKFASRRRRPGNPEKVIQRVLSKPTYQSDNIDTSSFLQGAKPINWVTKLAVLNKYISLGSDKLRNILGLTHYNEDQILCVVEYPTNHIVQLRNPTALDAACNYIFWSRGKRGSWGRTVDLDTSLDGLPEAVHGPLQLTSDFRFKFIGRLDKTAPALKLSKFRDAANKDTVRPCASTCEARTL